MLLLLLGQVLPAKANNLHNNNNHNHNRNHNNYNNKPMYNYNHNNILRKRTTNHLLHTTMLLLHSNSTLLHNNITKHHPKIITNLRLITNNTNSIINNLTQTQVHRVEVIIVKVVDDEWGIEWHALCTFFSIYIIFFVVHSSRSIYICTYVAAAFAF